MPQSLVRILVHIVFSTNNRTNLILLREEDALYRYISGIVRGNNARLITANGTSNHSHFLVSLGWCMIRHQYLTTDAKYTPPMKTHVPRYFRSSIRKTVRGET